VVASFKTRTLQVFTALWREHGGGISLARAAMGTTIGCGWPPIESAGFPAGTTIERNRNRLPDQGGILANVGDERIEARDCFSEPRKCPRRDAGVERGICPREPRESPGLIFSCGENQRQTHPCPLAGRDPCTPHVRPLLAVLKSEIWFGISNTPSFKSRSPTELCAPGLGKGEEKDARASDGGERRRGG
jgi:hypothetical protein